jgi:2-polyprenyl-6-methoxyphenol hydroxylase-like FAD-dependent oxidoreductase
MTAKTTAKTVLISGAGIAGATLAWWLARSGFRVTVVERAAALRSSGNPVDVRGAAVPVVKGMGLHAALRDAATQVRELVFVDARGARVGRVSLDALQGRSDDREVEIPRGALASILHAAAHDDVESLFGDEIRSLRQDAAGVDVTFERSAPRRFDLLIGTDGLHSGVRQRVFGPEAMFADHLGIYVATLPFDDAGVPAHQVQLFNSPDRLISLHPVRGQALAALMFRSPAVAGFDPRDVEANKRILATAFAGQGWRAGELLERLALLDDFYFDSVSRVRVPRWSEGRVALLGDAASCVSLFGDGTSLAIAGAFTLAEELAASPADHAAAFARYEARHRALVEPRMANMELGARLLIPGTRLGITLRNAATRLWPLAAALSWARRQVPLRPAARMGA